MGFVDQKKNENNYGYCESCIVMSLTLQELKSSKRNPKKICYFCALERWEMIRTAAGKDEGGNWQVPDESKPTPEAFGRDPKQVQLEGARRKKERTKFEKKSEEITVAHESTQTEESGKTVVQVVSEEEYPLTDEVTLKKTSQEKDSELEGFSLEGMDFSPEERKNFILEHGYDPARGIRLATNPHVYRVEGRDKHNYMEFGIGFALSNDEVSFVTSMLTKCKNDVIRTLAFNRQDSFPLEWLSEQYINMKNQTSGGGAL